MALCTECGTKEAVTNDGKLCKGCLRVRLDAMQLPKHGMFDDSRGRPSNNYESTEGSSDMRTTDEIP